MNAGELAAKLLEHPERELFIWHPGNRVFEVEKLDTEYYGEDGSEAFIIMAPADGGQWATISEENET